MKLSLSGDGQYFNLMEILTGLKQNLEQFQSMCVLAGCDYLKNVRGVGIVTAQRMIAANAEREKLFSMLKEKGAPAKYEEDFHGALAVFSHQTVFDINAGKTVSLKEWQTPPTDEQQLRCGKYPFSNSEYICVIRTFYISMKRFVDAPKM
jgi:exonuclease-1